MLVKDVMTRSTRFIAKDASLDDAAQVMERDAIGFLPVRDGGQLVGVVTDRDMALRSSTHKNPYESLHVEDVMSPRAHAIRSHVPIVGAAQAMKQKGVQRLLVIDDEQQLVGVVSLSDLAQRGHTPALAGEVLAHLSESTGPRTKVHA